MNDMTSETEDQPRFSDQATQTRWNWVHQAIRFAKERNRSALLDDEGTAVAARRGDVTRI